MRVWISSVFLAAATGAAVLAQEPAPAPAPPAPGSPAPVPPSPVPAPAPVAPASGGAGAVPNPAPGAAAKPPVTAKDAQAAAKIKPAPEDKCPAWAVNGYRIGMTLEEATAVRPVTTSSKNERIRLVSTETLKGTLTFNSANHLIRWEGDLVGADPESVKTAALEKWGPPRKTDTMGQFRKVHRKNWIFYTTIWQASECDTRILAEIGKYKGKPTKGPTNSIKLMLTLPPDNERKDVFKMQQGEDWLK